MKTLPLLIACACSMSAAAATEQTPATWQSHEMDFAFMGFTTHYSCDGLADKMRILLLAAGARADAGAAPAGCPSLDRPDPFARVHLRFATLAPVAGATGNAAPSDTVTAVWRHLTLSDHQPIELERGDCELVEQFKSAVLPKFSTRNVSDGPRCVPHEELLGQPHLSFDVLAPAPASPPPG
jgi:hypothetical protein